MSAEIRIGESISVAWERLQPQMGMMALITLVLIVVNIAAGSFSFGIAALVIQGPLFLGYYQCARKVYRGESVAIGDLFNGFNDFLPAFLNNLLMSIFVGIGFILCVIPGFIVMGFVAFWPLCLDDGHRNGVDALQRSKDLVIPCWPMMTILVIVLGVLKAAGFLVCCVGLLITIPMAALAIVHTYEQLRQSNLLDSGFQGASDSVDGVPGSE